MKDVSTPFRTRVPAGTCTFNVNVPKNNFIGDRKFYFSNLHVQPDFFNKEADLFGLDADTDGESLIDYPIQVRLDFADVTTFYGPGYKNSSTTLETENLIEALNEHFELHRPDCVYATPFFIDWIDLEKHEDASPVDYVPQNAVTYYGSAIREGLHDDKLPNSVQGMDNVNNFLLPIASMNPILFSNRIRLRIWLGPFARAVFSSNQPFVEDLGFTFEQFGKSYKSQYILTNKSQFWMPVRVAENPMQLTFTKNIFNVTVVPYSSAIKNKLNITSMTKREWKDNEKVTLYLKNVFNVASSNLNIIFSFGFNPIQQTFYFNFPESDNASIKIACVPDFALRLGYGQETFIVKGMQATSQKRENTIIDAHYKALAMVYDTGLVICTLDNTSSNTTSGSDNEFMTALYPQMSGLVVMPEGGISHAVHLNLLKQSTAAFVPITFRLLRIYENEKCANLIWNHDAYVYGTLTGTCVPSNSYKRRAVDGATSV